MANARPACWNRARLAPCPSCGAEMHLFRRSPEPGHHAYEVQIFSCRNATRKLPGVKPRAT